MREWSQVAKFWGGGAYKAVAKDAGGTVLGYSPAAEGEWVELDGPSKPMVDPEDDVRAPQPPAPSPAPASALPPELTHALAGLAKGIEVLTSTSARTHERLDRLEADRHRPEGEGQSLIASVLQSQATMFQAVTGMQAQAAERSEKLVMALLTREPPPPPPPPSPAPNPVATVMRILEFADKRQAPAAPPPPPVLAAPPDPLMQFASTVETMQKLGYGPAGAGGTETKLVDGALALAGRFFDAESRERSDKADVEKQRIAAEKEVEVARQRAVEAEARARAEAEARARTTEGAVLAAQPVPQATLPRPAEPGPKPPPAAAAPEPAVPAAAAPTVTGPVPAASGPLPAPTAPEPTVSPAAAPPAASASVAPPTTPGSEAAPAPTPAAASVAAPPPPPSIVVDMSEIPEDLRNVLQDALRGIPPKETAKFGDLIASMKKLSPASRAKFVRQLVPSLSDSDCSTAAEAMMEIPSGMLLSTVLPLLGGQAPVLTPAHLNGSNVKSRPGPSDQ